MCGTWPLSATLDLRRKRIRTISRLGGAHYLHRPTHQISWKCVDRGQRYATEKKFETGSLAAEFYFLFQFWQQNYCHPSATFLHIIVQNFKKMAQRTAELSYCDSTLSLHRLPLNLHRQRHNDTVLSCVMLLSSVMVARQQIRIIINSRVSQSVRPSVTTASILFTSTARL